MEMNVMLTPIVGDSAFEEREMEMNVMLIPIVGTLVEKSALATRRLRGGSEQPKHLEGCRMSRTLIQRIATTLLPFVLAACAATGGAQNTPTREDGRARLAKAEAMFAERCKKSGEFIHRTAQNVEGVFVMKIRPKGINYGDQFALTDPYGNDSEGDSYIKSFLKGYHPRSLRPVPGAPPRLGYHYVEALDAKDGKRYRYTGSRKVVGRMDASAPNVKVDLARDPNFDLNIYAFTLDRIPAPGPAPRYQLKGSASILF